MIKSKKPLSPEKTFGTNGVSYSFPAGEGGPINIAVNFARVPAPASYYYADAVFVKNDDGLMMSNLGFCRKTMSGDSIADRIDVVMPSAALRQFSLNAREVDAAVDQVLAQLGATRTVKPVFPADSGATTLFANMIFIVAGQGESSLDFYHLPPRDVHLAKTEKIDMQIVPIVRVILSSVLTKYFLELVKQLATGTSASDLLSGGKVHATASR